jgi:glutamate N-acetyltransferase/amino-acid N-acetyltransferase
MQTPIGDVSSAQCKEFLVLSHHIPLTCSGYTVLPDNASINPTSVSVSFVPSATASDSTPLQLLTNGEPEENIDEARASEILSEEDLEVVVDLGNGDQEARVWTCDFSHVNICPRSDDK